MCFFTKEGLYIQNDEMNIGLKKTVILSFIQLDMYRPGGILTAKVDLPYSGQLIQLQLESARMLPL